MSKALLIAASGVIFAAGYIAGSKWGAPVPQSVQHADRPTSRYEIRDAKIVGTVIRFDRVNGAVEYVRPTGPVVGTAADKKVMVPDAELPEPEEWGE